MWDGRVGDWAGYLSHFTLRITNERKQAKVKYCNDILGLSPERFIPSIFGLRCGAGTDPLNEGPV